VRKCDRISSQTSQSRVKLTAVSEPIFSKMSLMKEFMIDMAFDEIPVSCAGSWL